MAGERVDLAVGDIIDEVADRPVCDPTQDFSECLVLRVSTERLEGFPVEEHPDLDEVDVLSLVQVLHDFPGDDAAFETPALHSESPVLNDDPLPNFFWDFCVERNEHYVPEQHARISLRVTLQTITVFVNI